MGGVVGRRLDFWSETVYALALSSSICPDFIRRTLHHRCLLRWLLALRSPLVLRWLCTCSLPRHKRTGCERAPFPAPPNGALHCARRASSLCLNSALSHPLSADCATSRAKTLRAVRQLTAAYPLLLLQSAGAAPAKGLKRTLTNGGLYPQPEKGKLVSRASGSMAVFTEGQPALGGAESGTAN